MKDIRKKEKDKMRMVIKQGSRKTLTRPKAEMKRKKIKETKAERKKTTNNRLKQGGK